MVLAFGIATAALIIFFCWWGNLKRPLLSSVEELIPNQLMTTYPVVFLSGKKSLFYFMNYWNKLPERMSEHGYEVQEWPLPWRSTTQIQKYILQHLDHAQQKGQSFHIIADASSSAELKYLASLGHPAIQTLNLVECEGSSEFASASLRPYRTPIRTHKVTALSQQKGWTQWLVRTHRLFTSRKFEPQVLGSTLEQSKLERFYLSLLTELAVQDLRS